MSDDTKSSRESEEAQYEQFKAKAGEIESRMSGQIREMTHRYERDIEIASQKLHRTKWNAIIVFSLAVIAIEVASTMYVNRRAAGMNTIKEEFAASVAKVERLHSELDKSVTSLDAPRKSTRSR